MSSLSEVLVQVGQFSWAKIWADPAWQEYLASGSPAALERIPKFDDGWHSTPDEILEALPRLPPWDVVTGRFLLACCSAGHVRIVGPWLARLALRDWEEGSGSDRFPSAVAWLKGLGIPEAVVTEQVAREGHHLILRGNDLAPVGRYLMSLPDPLLLEADITAGHWSGKGPVARMMALHAPARWKRMLGELLTPATFLNAEGRSRLAPDHWLVTLNANPGEFLEVCAGAFELLEESEWLTRHALGRRLVELCPGRFEAALEAHAARALLRAADADTEFWEEARQEAALCWLRLAPERAAPAVATYLAMKLNGSPLEPSRFSAGRNEVLDLAAQRLGTGVVPLLEACFSSDLPEVQVHALQLWVQVRTPGDGPALVSRIRSLLQGPNPLAVRQAIRWASELVPDELEEDLWALLAHKSRPLREATARALASLGDSRLPRAAGLWAARRSEVRQAAVSWLQALGTPGAMAVLKARLESEEDDNVRDPILLALEKAGGPAGEVSPAEQEARVGRTLARLKQPPAPWLASLQLPAVLLKDGSPLPADWLKYLLYRQSRVKEMRADLEALPLYNRLERRTAGDLAVALAKAYFGTETAAEDRWVLAFAAVLGDDRLVPVLSRQIREWADGMRGKLAEYAVQALALLGTDAALLAVDTMAIRYRSKNKNVGKAAQEAFAAAARVRGLTVEELGDLVVPWLGFEPGQSRIIDTGRARFAVDVGIDFKVLIRDAATNKRVAKLPAGAPDEDKAWIKDLPASLKEAVKSQLLRMETLMVRQFRWPVARWRELFLRHPLLLPFAQRLVWGCFDGAGRLTATCRALADRTFTDAADDPVTLPEDGVMGGVHPLELTPEVRAAWLQHLADYEIEPPFAQLDRPVCAVAEGQRGARVSDAHAGTEINAMTFKGRAERLGWVRGSVCDAGSVAHYFKSFPAAGVDAFLGLDGFYVGIDMYSSIKLGQMLFVRHGSVEVGSYTYDEPGDGTDERVVSLGDVPAIAFSEAMGDLRRIAGAEAGTEAGEP